MDKNTFMNKKILIIDDDLVLCQILGEILIDEGHSVDSSYEGEEGLAMMRENGYDIIFSDIKLPGMDGIDILKKMRKEDTKIPIFIITAFSNEERFKLANKFNASGFIVKTNDLQREIQNITSAIGIAENFKGR